jgi:general secretion pathway protein M
MNQLIQWYAGLQEREQRMVAVGGVVLGILLLVGGLLMPLHSAVSSANRRVQTLHEDLQWMRINASEVRAGSGLLPVDTGEAPVVMVNRIGREAGLGTALRGTSPSGIAGVRVQLESAPFDTLVAWLATLEQNHGLSVDSISVDHAGKPGVVNASVTFTSPHH